MKKSVIVAVALVGLGALLVVGMRASRPVAEVCAAQRGTAISAVYGTVKVVASLTFNLNTRNSGVIQFAEPLASGKVLVGSEVQRGQELARLVNEDLDREIAKADTDLRAAQERQKLGPPSQPPLNTQQAQLERMEKLAQLQNVSASDVEQLRNEVQRLQEAVRSEQVELDREVAIFREQDANLQDRKARGIITSPIDGILTAVNVLNGEFVAEGSVPFAVESKSSYLEGQVNEEDVGRIMPTMKASVRLYAFADRDFTATVSQILPTATNQRYTITLTMDDPPANLLTGMTGEMNVIAGKHENALIVPSRALLADHVFVVEDGVVQPRAVKVGFHNLERAEILDGLQEGDQVIVADQDLFKTGERVRPIATNM